MSRHRRQGLIAAGILVLAAALYAALGTESALPSVALETTRQVAAKLPAELRPPWLEGALPGAEEPAAAPAQPAVVAAAAPPQLRGLAPSAALKALKSCYFADTCGLAGPEGLEAHFAASRAIVEQLKALPAQASVAEQASLAREFLAFPDGHVQAEALAMAARLPPDLSTVNAAVTALRESFDSVLFKQALPVLQQWQQQGMSSGYDDMLLTTVHTGGWHAAQTVAEGLTPFLHEANVARFEAVAKQLEPGARRNALQQSLRNYYLQRSGG